MSAFSDSARMGLLRLAQQLGLDSDTHQEWLDAPYPEDEGIAIQWCEGRVKELQGCIADAHCAWGDPENAMTKEDWDNDHDYLIRQAHKICDE